jgi:hypothetical protein
MKELKTSFRLNGLPYTLLKRNEFVALYGIGGTYTNKILHWEVCKIYIRKDQYGEREAIPSNEKFGRDRSRCFYNEESALRYFDELTVKLNKLNLRQGVPNVVTGVEVNVEVMPEYYLV